MIARDLTFNYYQPTRVVYGAGAVSECELEMKRLGAQRVVVVTDRVLREKTDSVAKVERALGARLAGVWDGALADAPAEVIDQGAAAARALLADGVLSIGGGSAIDTAKGMAIVLTLGGSIRDHQGSGALPRPLIPHLAIPTTAGTGSEASSYIVVLDDQSHEKMHYTDDRIVPLAAILDPQLTVGMPRWLTAATACDALTHAIEATCAVPRNPLADAPALHAVSRIALALPRVLDDGADLAARGELLCAAHLAGQAFNASGVGLVHAMAHVVGARHRVHHGTANAICLPHVMRWNSDELSAELASVARALGIAEPDPQRAALAAADRVAGIVRDSGLPTRLRDVNVPESALDGLAEQALSDGAIVYNGKFAAEKELVLGLFRAAW